MTAEQNNTSELNDQVSSNACRNGKIPVLVDPNHILTEYLHNILDRDAGP